MSKILLVEDDETFLLATVKLMSRDFDEVLSVGPTTPYDDARRLWEEHSDLKVALVALEIPGPNGEERDLAVGYQLVTELKALRTDARVGILTSYSGHQHLARAIESGADQFLSKRAPATERRAAACFLKAWVTSAPALQALAESIAWRDPSTVGHGLRVRDYCLEIARVLDIADGRTFDLAACKVGAELHDLGKIEIPDDILLNAGRLSHEQRQVMQRHVDAIRELGRLLGPEFQSVGECAYQHHRAYSNTATCGIPDYPKDDKLPREDEQSLLVRVMHVADVLDALLTDRSYRAGRPLEKAIKIIQDETAKGAFDPRVVAALSKLSETDNGIARLGVIQQEGRIVDSANHLLDLYFGDRRLTPGRLRTLLNILSDLYLRNGKAADVLSMQEIVLGDFNEVQAGATIRIRLGGKPEDLAQAEQILNDRMKEAIWCGEQLKADVSTVPDEIRDLVARNVREVPLHVTPVNVSDDVTERRLAEEALRREEASSRKSEVQYRRLFESARDGILILEERTGRIIDANPFMSELLGYDLAHFLGKELWEIGLFKDIAANQAAFQELQANGYIRYDHLPLETRDKRKVDVEVVSNAYEADGRLVIQCNIRDCSDRFRLEQEIRRSLEEKEVLLKEVHHRVKNNLQVISSLLHMQSQHTQDPASVRMFRASQNRVRSMAMIHERLYRSRDMAHVDFTDYIESLAAHLFNAHQVDSDRISLAVDVHEVRLSIDSAIPCGLLLNELISNCLKHAFRGKGRGTIHIELLPAGAGEILLSVSDDGVGLPPGVELRSAETFGMQLITDLVEQLHGKVQLHRNAGTTVRVVFPTGEPGHADKTSLSQSNRGRGLGVKGLCSST